MAIIRKGKQWLSCRDVLWIMVFFGFAVNYIIRINMNIAIVAMVIPRPEPAAVIQCSQENSTNMNQFVTNVTSSFSSNSTLSSSIISEFPPDEQFRNRYAWNEYEQGLVLGAYYWLYWLTQIPGGTLARKYGTKKIFGYGNFAPIILGFFIPYATRQHLYILVFFRILQGFAAGVTWPSMHSMTAKWIPPNERSKFVSAYLGSSVGAAIAYPLCAFVMSSFGWEAAFTVTAAIGIVWYCLWLVLVYDSPNEHPRISAEEKNKILRKLADSVTVQPTKIPWKSILTSGPLWITCLAQWGNILGFLTFTTQSPTYFYFIHGWNINAIGIISGLSHLLRAIFSYFFSIICDWLLRTSKMSRTNVRKFATFMCTGVQGIFTLGLAYSGCHPYLAAAFMIAGTTASGAVSSGILSVLVDLSPNYASILLGICGFIAGVAGFVSPVIVSVLTNNNQTIEQWRIVFLIFVINLVISCIGFSCFGTAEEQPWNCSYGNEVTKTDQELHALNSKAKIKQENIVINDTDKLTTLRTEQK